MTERGILPHAWGKMPRGHLTPGIRGILPSILELSELSELGELSELSELDG